MGSRVGEPWFLGRSEFIQGGPDRTEAFSAALGQDQLGRQQLGVATIVRMRFTKHHPDFPQDFQSGDDVTVASLRFSSIRGSPTSWKLTGRSCLWGMTTRLSLRVGPSRNYYRF